MLKALRKKMVAVVMGLSLAAIPLAAPALVQAGASIEGNVSCGTKLQIETGDCTGDLGEGSVRVQEIITTIVNLFSIFVGIIAVIMIIFGGFKYVTAGGDSGNLTSARQTIIYALIGLVIVALAQVLVQFVLDKTITGA